MKAKVLLIYPAPFRVTGLPIGLATLSAVLKEKGHRVKIFDTAFYVDSEKASQTTVRSERMLSKMIPSEETYLPVNNSSMEEDLIALIREYTPDVIGISVLEIMYEITLKITRLLKKEFKDIPIIVGGVFPTLAPEIVIGESSVDMICLGEGETALPELCDRIVNRKSYVDIEGLWVKSNSKINKNVISALHDVNELPCQDFSEFDERLFYKPMQGRMYKMVNVETSRGCSFNCTYCGAPQVRSFFRENNSGSYFRMMNMDKMIEQIRFQVERHNPEFIYFTSESFLSMREKEFEDFVRAYDKIRIPFWIQTRIETISMKRLSELRKIGMHWLSIGLEHGNEEFRKNILKRKYSNKVFMERMEFLHELNMGASVNNIIGLPFETRELIFDTIKMNRALWQRNPYLEINVFLFTPYKGCELYDLCKENGLLKDMVSISTSTLSGQSVLNLPEEFAKDVEGLIRAFNLYVRLPEKYYDQIRIAERCDGEGNAMLKKLKAVAEDYDLSLREKGVMLS